MHSTSYSGTASTMNTGSETTGATPKKGFKRLTWKTSCNLDKAEGSKI